MASNVIVLYNQRRLQIKVTPTRSLSDVQSEACAKFSLDPLRYTLKRGNTTLDLSLQIRFTNLGPGAKLELVQAKNLNSPITVVLRIQDNGPTNELTGQVVGSDTIWGVLQKFERKHKGLNITEKYASSATQGAGRLLYEMPAVRVVNREFVSFADLQQSLVGLGVRDGKLLVVVRFKSTSIPYEEALEEIAKFSPKEAEEDLLVPEEGEASGSGSGSGSGSAVPEQAQKEVVGDVDVDMADTPAPVVAGEIEGDPTGAGPSIIEIEASGGGQSDSKAPVDPDKPNVSVYRPSDSTTLAAAQINVPETAYDIGITEAKIIQHHLKKAAIGQRLPSDKEIEEKEAAALAIVEKVQSLVIKVRFPDGYTSEQSFQAKHTAQDLYDTIRTTMRHPFEPFYLMIPPKEVIPETRQRLTIDLRIRSGASVHLIWGADASNAARTQPALNDGFLQASKSLPEVRIVEGVDVEEDEKGKGVGRARGKKEMDRGAKENKLKSLLGFGKK